MFATKGTKKPNTLVGCIGNCQLGGIWMCNDLGLRRLSLPPAKVVPAAL
jgi:hypothetical protein